MPRHPKLEPPSPSAFVAAVRVALEARRDPERAASMAAYMKDRFPFLGAPQPVYRAAMQPLWPDRQAVTADWVRETAAALLALPEREFHYAAIGLMDRSVRVLEPSDLETLTALVLTRAWWDAVDPFASRVAGGLLRRFPGLEGELDAMSVSADLWRRRIAILHQLSYKSATDWERLQRYALDNAAHESFWVRKALGWAFREYTRTDPGAVLGFFEAHGERFSALTRREALKHFGG